MKQGIMIFGSTGNLMYKKLIPAIDHLLKKGHIAEDTKIYAMARRDCTLEDYIQDAKDNMIDDVNWDKIEPLMEYIILDVNNVEDYKTIKTQIEDDGIEDLVIYLAVPPFLFPVIAKGISESGIIQKGDQTKRIVFEKPFGEDLASAKSINKDLWQYFDEKQIYRIDHYLGKEMIQNILMVRFANKIFEQVWNHESIAYVMIVAKEEESVLSRGNYYDKIGALKDMLQSHLLQMAALVAMEAPETYTSEAIKEEKVAVLKALKLVPKDIILGQYKGYKKEDKVDPNSNTETFVFAQASIDNDRWRGVPFYFMTGKKLDEKRSEIIVQFKTSDKINTMWPEENTKNNRLQIEVAPDEGVVFQFNVKNPGLSNKLTSAKLDYCHSCQAVDNTPEAYERLLLDLLKQNRTLFTRWDEIETTWTIVEKASKRRRTLFTYDTFDDVKEEIINQYGEAFDDL
ncbi:MAG: glucose-6-phosphate dehydrogenase [Candidatus Izimaplasma sp.]|nr:glucose-6-phosphate dehydrogenase [Candidatus Izimaplasma bacterium]